MCLCDLKLGEKAKIHEINGNDKLTKRLHALGLIQGTEIELKRVAPLGDPLVVNLRGFDLAIRKKDAKNIILKSSKKPSFLSTVTPAQLPTLWLEPVRLLKSVVFPTLGLPSKATFFILSSPYFYLFVIKLLK